MAWEGSSQNQYIGHPKILREFAWRLSELFLFQLRTNLFFSNLELTFFFNLELTYLLFQLRCQNLSPSDYTRLFFCFILFMSLQFFGVLRNTESYIFFYFNLLDLKVKWGKNRCYPLDSMLFSTFLLVDLFTRAIT